MGPTIMVVSLIKQFSDVLYVPDVPHPVNVCTLVHPSNALRSKDASLDENERHSLRYFQQNLNKEMIFVLHRKNKAQLSLRLVS